MNIYVLDPVPELAAQGHCDGDLVKSVYDLAVLLSTAHQLSDGTSGENWYPAIPEPNTLAKWVSAHAANYDWAYALMVALAREHEHRFGVGHLSWVHMGEALGHTPRSVSKDHKIMDFILEMPHGYRVAGENGIITSSRAVEAYRAYYRAERMQSWTNRAIPDWCKS